MDSIKKRHLAEQVRPLRARFVQTADTVLGDALPAPLLRQWVAEEAGRYRQRIYDPLQTLMLFIEQVLSADHSCQDAVARGVSGRVAQGQAPGSLNTAAYSKARSRLAVGLIERLGGWEYGITWSFGSGSSVPDRWTRRSMAPYPRRSGRVKCVSPDGCGDDAHRCTSGQQAGAVRPVSCPLAGRTQGGEAKTEAATGFPWIYSR
ncbi:MAG: hypothetical protein ACYCZJ_02565 [Sulfuriferula sp.]